MSIADKKTKLKKLKENVKNPKLKEYWEMFEKGIAKLEKEIKDVETDVVDAVEDKPKAKAKPKAKPKAKAKPKKKTSVSKADAEKELAKKVGKTEEECEDILKKFKELRAKKKARIKKTSETKAKSKAQGKTEPSGEITPEAVIEKTTKKVEKKIEKKIEKVEKKAEETEKPQAKETSKAKKEAEKKVEKKVEKETKVVAKDSVDALEGMVKAIMDSLKKYDKATAKLSLIKLRDAIDKEIAKYGDGGMVQGFDIQASLINVGNNPSYAKGGIMMDGRLELGSAFGVGGNKSKTYKFIKDDRDSNGKPFYQVIESPSNSVMAQGEDFQEVYNMFKLFTKGSFAKGGGVDKYVLPKNLKKKLDKVNQHLNKYGGRSLTEKEAIRFNIDNNAQSGFEAGSIAFDISEAPDEYNGLSWHRASARYYHLIGDSLIEISEQMTNVPYDSYDSEIIKQIKGTEYETYAKGGSMERGGEIKNTFAVEKDGKYYDYYDEKWYDYYDEQSLFDEDWAKELAESKGGNVINTDTFAKGGSTYAEGGGLMPVEYIDYTFKVSPRDTNLEKEVEEYIESLFGESYHKTQEQYSLHSVEWDELGYSGGVISPDYRTFTITFIEDSESEWDIVQAIRDKFKDKINISYNQPYSRSEYAKGGSTYAEGGEVEMTKQGSEYWIHWNDWIKLYNKGVWKDNIKERADDWVKARHNWKTRPKEESEYGKNKGWYMYSPSLGRLREPNIDEYYATKSGIGYGHAKGGRLDMELLDYNIGGALAVASQVKGVAPKSVDGIDSYLANKFKNQQKMDDWWNTSPNERKARGYAGGGQIDNAYLNASKKDELFIRVVKNDKVKEYPINTKSVKGIENQVNEFYEDEDVQDISLVRYWNSSKQGGVDDVTQFSKGGLTPKQKASLKKYGYGDSEIEKANEREKKGSKFAKTKVNPMFNTYEAGGGLGNIAKPFNIQEGMISVGNNVKFFKKGGGLYDNLKIKKGTFTKKAKNRGMTTKAFMKEVLSNPENYTMKTRRQAQLMKNMM